MMKASTRGSEGGRERGIRREREWGGEGGRHGE